MKNFIPMIIDNLSDAGVDLTEDQANIFLKNNRDLERTLIAYYGDQSEDDNIMDTQDRDLLCDDFARYITGSAWPMFGDTAEYKNKFKTAMQEAVKSGQIMGFAE